MSADVTDIKEGGYGRGHTILTSRDVTSAVGIFNIEFWRTLTLLSLCLRHVI
jgi:hypothetical protein